MSDTDEYTASSVTSDGNTEYIHSVYYPVPESKRYNNAPRSERDYMNRALPLNISIDTTLGTMTLKRPGKIRFDYGEDSELLVVSNGRSLYMIDYEVNQVERWPIRNSPLGALLDPDRDVSQYGTLIPTGSPSIGESGVPAR